MCRATSRFRTARPCWLRWRRARARSSTSCREATAWPRLRPWKSLGAGVTWLSRRRLVIRGQRRFRAPDGPIDCGNSGTGMRLLCGLLAGRGLDVQLRGDASLSGRPMRRVVEPLQRMGARIEALGEDGRPPLRIGGGTGLRGISYVPPVPSAQVKSAILLAGLAANGETCVRESTLPAIIRSACCRASGCPWSARPARFASWAGSRCARRELKFPATSLRRRSCFWAALLGGLKFAWQPSGSTRDAPGFCACWA